MSRQQQPIDLSTLRGQIAIVTGSGNGGIGWGISRHAASLGMHVVMIDLHQGLVDDAALRLRDEFPEVDVIGVQCDVTVESDMARSLELIDAHFNGASGGASEPRNIGAVFANAGVIFNRTILKSTLDEWATTLNVNVLGVVNTLRHFAPRLREQGTECLVVNTASIGGLVRGDGGGGAYQASKHAVVALTESLSFELARNAPWIHVHVLCPCIVQSALGATSQVNVQVAAGARSADEVHAPDFGDNGLSMTTERHAEQVFDLIAAGHFYLITDNVRPYVDHDSPFDGLAIVRERFENMMALQVDNADAFVEREGRRPSAILKGPMFKG
jgi:NAD(P)-dependent dehydrogenase (short-subunit alcohol dehydrogenase family)